MRHQEFLAGVATRGGFAETDDARRAADAVLATLAEHLPGDDRTALVEALPNLLEVESGVDRAGGGGTPTEAGLVDEVARRSGWAPERARYALTAVIGQLGAEDADLGERIGRVVPRGPAGHRADAPARRRVRGRAGPPAAGGRRRARAASCSACPSGRATSSGIERTVELPPERLDLVLERLRARRERARGAAARSSTARRPR